MARGSRLADLNGMWASLRLLAGGWGSADGYSVELAVRLAQMTRAELARHGIDDVRGWRDLGVSVERRVLFSSGMLIGRTFPMKVWVNAKDDWRRQRFTVGHEIAHYLLPPRYGLLPDLLEQMCDAYASEMLLPASRVRSRLGASGNLTSARDVVEMANEARINFSPVLYQAARTAWDPNFSIILGSAKTGCLRVLTGAGPRIGSPPRGQRISSLGRWRVLRTETAALARRSGVAELDYRFIRPSEPDEQESQSGRVQGLARWDSVELPGRQTVITVNFLGLPNVTFH
ncbi:hypothetical protein F4558_002772 [Micromonospora profundi]|uniref:ImmA/IrrE family metallo-endopeptidase n=1 Tax=Micromonospora profundi TaxID=1420889 RepID=UPI00143B77F3|nr:ImmA/IrrE family metallo-endopeptidase [Micromonospora profundi]NJC12946.1 hypothetical protein [Micromonospora profundi]